MAKKLILRMIRCLMLPLLVVAVGPDLAHAQSGFRMYDQLGPEQVSYQEMLGPWHIQCRRPADASTMTPAKCDASFREIKRVSGYLDPVFEFDFRIAPERRADGTIIHNVIFSTHPAPTWSEARFEIGTWVLSLRKECKTDSCHLSDKNAKLVIDRMRKGASRCRMTFQNDNGRRQVDIPLYNFAAVLDRLEQHTQ